MRLGKSCQRLLDTELLLVQILETTLFYYPHARNFRTVSVQNINFLAFRDYTKLLILSDSYMHTEGGA